VQSQLQQVGHGCAHAESRSKVKNGVATGSVQALFAQETAAA
jgi:hypothetical protein